MSLEHAHSRNSRVAGSSGRERYAAMDRERMPLVRSMRFWVIAASASSRSFDVVMRRRSRNSARRARFSLARSSTMQSF
jgi:hypothetical protein